MQEIPTLETERLILRAPKEDDTRAYQKFYADGEASKFYGGPLDADAAWIKLATQFPCSALFSYWKYFDYHDGS